MQFSFHCQSDCAKIHTLFAHGGKSEIGMARYLLPVCHKQVSNPSLSDSNLTSNESLEFQVFYTEREICKIALFV